MARFPDTYGRRRKAELDKKQARGDKDLPTKLLNCDDLHADANDEEVTYFNQFVVFRVKPTRKGAKTGGGYAALPGWVAVAHDKRLQTALASRFRAIGQALKPLATDPAAPRPPRGKAVGRRRPTLGTRLNTGNTIAPLGIGFANRLQRRTISPPVMMQPAPGKPAVGVDIQGYLDGVVASAAGYYATVADFDLKKAIWAVGLEFEQVWHSDGYRRGRLVRSIPLAPGEQLEIQVKTWDRQTTKKTLVESIEQNLSTEITGEEKWTLAAKMNFTDQTNASVQPTAGVKGGVTLPIQELPLDLGGNLGIGGTLSDAMTNAMDSSNEFVQTATTKSAQSLKSVRTNTVETTLESGIETTTKQVIANTNRCHSVTYHYFEVVEDFTITTQPVAADLYLLLPLTVPEITPEWVLCHECELRRVMRCAEYYPGFEGAKYLLMQQLMAPGLAALQPPGGTGSSSSDPFDAQVRAVIAAYHVLRDASILPAMPSDPGTIIDAIGKWISDAGPALSAFGGQVGALAQEGIDEVTQLVTDTTKTVETGLAAVGDAVGGALDAAGGFLGFARSIAPPAGAQQQGHPADPKGGPGSYIYWGLASIAAPQMSEAFEYLESAWPAASGAAADRRLLAEITVLQEFFGRLGDPKLTFRKVDAAVAMLGAGAVAEASAAGGIVVGVAGAIVGGILTSEIPGVTTWVGVAIGGAAGAAIGATYAAAGTSAVLGFIASLEGLGIADTVPDDEGLKAKVEALWAQYNTVRSTAPITGQVALGSGSAADPAAVAAAYNQAVDALRAAAEAQVEFNRLACHISENQAFYMQAIWSGWTGDKISAELENLHIPAGVVANRLSGFIGMRAAVKVVDLDWVKREGDLDWDATLARALRESKGAARPEAVTLPTPGMIVEPALGECCACEDFVQEHRKLDIAYREAEVRLAQAKADQAAYEAARFKKRIDEGELGDPTPYERARVRVNVPGEGE